MRTLDGLRGYLAFAVFVHHSVVWQAYRRGGAWEVTPSTFYNNLGHAAVALFFMLTAFLFYGRVTKEKDGCVDWLQLYISRVMRLVPAYWLALSLMVLIAFAVNGFVLRVPLPEFLRSIGQWLGMSFLDEPDINGLPRTKLVVAGVAWSLAYEWAFYLSLPLIAVAAGKLRTRKALFAPLLLLLLFLLPSWRPSLVVAAPFLGGIVAVHALSNDRLRSLATTRVGAILAVACLLGALFAFKSIYSPLPQVLLTAFFVVVASGNSLFGVLATRLSVAFGAPAYSMYLLHGLVLFATFRLLLGPATAAGLSPFEHWIVVWSMTPVVVVLSWLSNRLVERPCMRWTAALSRPA